MDITKNTNTVENVFKNKFNNEATANYENKINAVKEPWTIDTVSDAISEIAMSKVPGTKKSVSNIH